MSNLPLEKPRDIMSESDTPLVPLATRILVMLLIPLWFPLVLLGTWIAYRLEKKGYLLPNGRKR